MIHRVEAASRKISILNENILKEEKVIREITTKTNYNIELAKNADSAAEEQKNAIESTSKGVDHVNEMMAEMVTGINRLAEASKRIAENAKNSRKAPEQRMKATRLRAKMLNEVFSVRSKQALPTDGSALLARDRFAFLPDKTPATEKSAQTTPIMTLGSSMGRLSTPIERPTRKRVVLVATRARQATCFDGSRPPISSSPENAPAIIRTPINASSPNATQ
jgi:hypothetical protein